MRSRYTLDSDAMRLGAYPSCKTEGHRHGTLLAALAGRGDAPRVQIFSHSIEFSGGVGHCSSKASRREDLEIEQPVACWDFSSFHFHPTLASMLGATLIRYQVVEVR